MRNYKNWLEISVKDSNVSILCENIALSSFLSAYTMAKYGMTMCAMGMAEEFKNDGVAANTLWPRTGEYSLLHGTISTYITG